MACASPRVSEDEQRSTRISSKDSKCHVDDNDDGNSAKGGW